MNTKSFFASKLNWLGIITFVAGLGAFADQLPADVAKYVLAASGIAIVILRTFGTSTTISLPGGTN